MYQEHPSLVTSVIDNQMSRQFSSRYAPHTGTNGALAALARVWRRYRAVRKTRQALSRLNDRQLHDIGVPRDAIEGIAGRPRCPTSPSLAWIMERTTAVRTGLRPTVSTGSAAAPGHLVVSCGRDPL